ncbi:hypothetical protein G7046_g2024 [Stylonectria norvegica]|nr:hypothetical protein G7046_g2024 [Stylonectria norvegica]
MSNFLFPANDSVDHAKRKYTYPSLLGDLVRGSHDSMEALKLFRSLLRGDNDSGETPGFMAFDAHGGDTGCHLRAGMFLETFAIYRRMFHVDSERWQELDEFFDDLLGKLQDLSGSAQTACAKLTKDKVKPGKVGFHANQETPRNVLSRLGWVELSDKCSRYPMDSKRIEPGKEKPASSSDEPQDETTGRAITWDILRFSILCRLIIYSYILSKYKSFLYHHDKLIGRMDPPKADKLTEQLMVDHCDMSYSAYKHPGPKRLEREFSDIQCWMSELSSAWLVSLASRFSVQSSLPRYILGPKSSKFHKMSNTPESLIQGYLAQRASLSQSQSRLIFVDRHFCSHGYHVNVFLGEVSQAPQRFSMSSITRFLAKCFSRPHPVQENDPLQLDLGWEITRFSVEDLLSSSDQTSPHMVIMGNSINGPLSSYTSLVLSSRADSGRTQKSLPHQLCDGKSCTENEQHVKDFINADHDQIAKSTFAMHPSYPFPVGSAIDETIHVGKHVKDWGTENGKEEEARGLMDGWRNSSRNADVLGCGKECMSVFAWQHFDMSTSSEPKASSERAIPAPDPTAPPNGGAQAWRTVAGGWLCQFCSFGFINALGSFQYIYETDILKTKSSSDIAWILTVQLFLMFFLSQPVGLAVDMFGTRPILLVAMLFSIGGLIGLSFATEYWQIFLAQSLCFGLGAAGTFVPGLVAAGQFFTTKRAFALGIVASGSSCGGVIFPIMLARLFDRIGFRATMRWTALMIGVMLLIANLLVTTARPAKGLAGRRSLMSVATFKKPTYVLFAAGSFLFFWGLFGPFNYLPLFADDASTKFIALYTVSIVNAASIPGRIIPNFFSDRVGNLKSLTLMAFATGVTVLVIWVPINYHKSLAGLVIFALFFGFTSGAYVSLMTPALIEVAGGHTDDLGVMLGTYFAIISIASLTGLPIQGAIVDTGTTGGDTQLMGLIVFCGVSILCGSGLLSCSLLMRQKIVNK